MRNAHQHGPAVDRGAAPIVSDVPGSFPHGVLTRRHPDLIEAVRRQTPYALEIQRALDDLLAVIDGTIPDLPAGAEADAYWCAAAAAYVGRSWLEVPFLWAESYFYRLLLEATGYFALGPWRGIDPFAPQKLAELDAPELAADLAHLDRITSAEPTVALQSALIASLWGNRADLGFRMSDPGSTDRGAEDELVADDSARLWSHMESAPSGEVHVVADNAGRELVADLVLVDRLLETGRAVRVRLHLKPSPYYVSDATPSDLLSVLRHLHRSGGAAAQVASRLSSRLSTGDLEVHSDRFWCTPQTFEEMPDHLAAELRSALVVIVKGDLNYRRLVGDRHWLPTMPFGDLVDFPAPVVALRTLKCDVAVGVDPARLARLEAGTPGWRTDGTHAVIQARV